MPTNEERREIARKLSEKHIERNTPGYFEVQDLNFRALNYLKDLEACVPDGDSLFTVLADLIEPEPERKAKSKPFPIEKDTGYFDTTKCECGYLNDVSSTYCGQCGGVIEVV